MTPAITADSDCLGPEPSEQPLRCLIVEDQVMFLQLLSTMLQAIDGVQISHTATRCSDALAICQQDPPDLLILDLALPDGDGLLVAERLSEIKPNTQVVVLSGQATSFVCPTALQPMVRAVVDKTATFAQLQRALERCLQRQPVQLTPRQQQIFQLIGQGLSNREIATSTGLAVPTVETHRKAIAQKLGMRGAELIRQASLLGSLPNGAT